MNYDLIKFHHWLLTSTFKSKWFEENIKIQFISLLSWVIYPDYRSQNSLIMVIRHNKFILSIILIPILLCLTFFTFGRITASEKTVVVVKKSFINKSIDNLDFDKLREERRYIEYLAHSKYKVKNYVNLQKLSDEVFFTIVSEINSNKIPASIFFRLLDQESGFCNITNKNSGAKGIPQIMPCTRKYILNKIGKTNHHLIDDIRVASYHLREQYEVHKTSGNNNERAWLLSLVDYNGGSFRLAKHNMMYFSTDLK
jgi:hypothetical protein